MLVVFFKFIEVILYFWLFLLWGMAKQKTPNRPWSQLFQLSLDKALKKQVLREDPWSNLLHFGRLSYFMYVLWSIYFPSIVWYNRAQGMLELWRNHSRQKRKINLQIFQNKKNNALYHVMFKLKFYEGKNITCAVCIHKEYSSVTSYAMPCYAILCYATLCCANLFFNLLKHMWQPLTLLPRLSTVQKIWGAVFLGCRQIQTAAQPTYICVTLWTSVALSIGEEE